VWLRGEFRLHGLPRLIVWWVLATHRLTWTGACIQKGPTTRRGFTFMQMFTRPTNSARHRHPASNIYWPQHMSGPTARDDPREVGVVVIVAGSRAPCTLRSLSG
jgi:hypothetical protein